MPADLTPHPLVVALGLGDEDDKESVFQEAKKAVKKDPDAMQEIKDSGVPMTEALNDGIAAAAQGAAPTEIDVAGAPVAPHGPVSRIISEEAANHLAARVAPLDFVTLTGYVGGGVADDAVRLYLDATLSTYLSLDRNDVIHRHRFRTPSAPFDFVDVLWVKRDTGVGRGRRRPRRDDDESRFLEGDLMDAEDLASSLPTRIEGSVSDEPFCISYTCCRYTSNCPPGSKRK